jgi:CHAT domain-containing protein/tetratricopeptide (TPR) repeat protein
VDDVAENLGWLPMPAPPMSLIVLVDRTDQFLLNWFREGDRDALDALVATWLELLGEPAFSAADEDFRLTCYDRAALALSWQGAEDSDVAGMDTARRYIDLVIAARPAWLADARYHSGIVWYNRAMVLSEESSALAAITELRALAAELPVAERRLRHRCLDVLGRTLLWMQRRDENFVDLSEVIDLQMEALAGFAAGAPYRAQVLNTAASALRDRFKITGRIADLDLAIEILGEQETPQFFRMSAAFGISLLGVLLRERYLLNGRAVDLDRALACHERAVAVATLNNRMSPLTLTNQGNALLSAFHRDGDPTRLNEAIEAQAEAVRVTPPDDIFYPSRLNNLANSLSTAFDVTGDRVYLDQAVDLYRTSVALAPPADYDLPSRHYNLANILRDRGRRRDRREVSAHYRQACRTGLERSPEWALGAALAWADWAGARNDWRQAVEAFEWGTQAIELLFLGQATRQHKESWLRQAQGLPARAAYACARARRPQDAVLIQERGRTLLLAEVLRQRRTDVFTLPDIFRAAGTRPLVYLSPADEGGVALVVDPVHASVRTVYLPGATADAVERRVRLLVAGYRARSHDPSAWLGTLDAIGRWAHTAVLGPVLAELTRSGLDRAGALTLVSAGQLAMLPLHIAWEPVSGVRRYAQDRMAISYAPSAQALWAPDDTMVGRALVVDEPAPVNAPRLPWSWVERTAVEAAVGQTTLLRGAGATRASVLGQLRHHDLVHLSCHGIGHPDAPLDSALLMASNESLTLRDIIELDPAESTAPRLIVLSACESDQAGRNLPDEVVSFPTGLLQAGCRGVIATQWSVSSVATALLVTAFYHRWSGGNPARALCSAQRWLREATSADLAACLRPDRARHEIGLPPEAARPLWTMMRRRDPDEKPFAHPSEWAAFAHVGV